MKDAASFHINELVAAQQRLTCEAVPSPHERIAVSEVDEDTQVLRCLSILANGILLARIRE